MVEKFKTLIITLLSLAMVALLFAFFAITAVSDALKLDDIVFELFRRGEKTEATFADNDAFPISTPFQIALLKGNGSLYYPSGASSFMNVYRSTTRITDEALGSAVYEGELSQSDFLPLLLNVGVLYKYDFALPFSLLFPETANRFPEIDTNVADMLICLDGENVMLVITGSDNKYYRFSTLSDPAYINTLCGGYSENGQIAATYTNPDLAYSGIILNKTSSLPCYSIVKASSDGELPKSVMSSLGMNPYLSSVYRDGDSMIYMEDFHRIIIHPDGHISYFSEEKDKGISIDFDAQESPEEQFLQICTQSSNIVHQLWKVLSSNITSLNYSRYEETDSGCILYFEAYVGGCFVNDELHSAAAVEVSNGKIVNLSIHPLLLEEGIYTDILPFRQAAAIAPAGSTIAIQYNLTDDLLTPVTVFVKEETP